MLGFVPFDFDLLPFVLFLSPSEYSFSFLYNYIISFYSPPKEEYRALFRLFSFYFHLYYF